MLVDVSAKGAVLLGDSVSCDGFYFGHAVRVQTHIHQDHMMDFDTSKGMQDIFMSEPTFALLIARYNADIPSRIGQNIFTVDVPGHAHVGHLKIEFYDNRHMLGSMRVAVEFENGYRVGYSGDFAWPLEPNQVMQVDELVIDATYGSSDSTQSCKLGETKDQFRDLALRHMAKGPIYIQAHGGTLQHVLSCLDDLNDWPIITEREDLAREVEVYRNYGYIITRPVVSVEGNRENAREVIAGNKYIRVTTYKERPITNPRFPTYIITARYRQQNTPIMNLSGDIYTVSISDHADFEGTLAYVEASGAKKVMCDNSRSGHAPDLAVALKHRLGIEAVVSSNVPSFHWGV